MLRLFRFRTVMPCCDSRPVFVACRSADPSDDPETYTLVPEANRLKRSSALRAGW